MIARRAAAAGLLDPAPTVAVDATGFESRHVSRYFRWRREKGRSRRRGRRQRAWPKLTNAWNTGSHLILGAVTNTGPTQDAPDFTPTVRQAAGLLHAVGWPLDTVLADGAYDAEHHHALCHDALAVREVIIPINARGHGRRWPRAPYRRATKRRWARELRLVYGARWHAESGYSRHKRRLGSALTARRPAAQPRELILRVLTHNLMLLARCQQRISTEQGVP